MTSMVPALPKNCDLVGELHEISDVDFLTQDMMEVYCQLSETLIRVGWTPEEDPSGSYFVAVYRDCQLIQDIYSTRQLSEVKSVVERLAVQFCDRPFSKTVSFDSNENQTRFHAGTEMSTSRELGCVNA